MSRAVGIDLASRYGRVAYCANGEVKVLRGESGEGLTYCYVLFTDTEILVGRRLRPNSGINTKNFVSDIKFVIGRKFSDPQLQQFVKHLHYKIIDEADKPKVVVDIGGEAEILTPEEITALILFKMRIDAEKELGFKILDVVITVPERFDHYQRQATKNAGMIAGLNVLKIIDKSTAAAIAYDLNKKTDSVQKALILAYCHHSFDVTLLSIQNHVTTVIATTCDKSLSGHRLETRLFYHIITELRRAHNIDLDARKSIKQICSNITRSLYQFNVIDYVISSPLLGTNFVYSITRAKFEKVCADLFTFTVDQIESSLKYFKLDKSQVDEIVLIGGPSRITKLQNEISDFFDGKKPNTSLDPDCTVAYGAAIEAAKLAKNRSSTIQNLSTSWFDLSESM